MIVSFTDYELEPRYDAVPWDTVRIEEATTEAGTYTQIDEFDLVPIDPNPADPMPRSFTTENATLESGWYKVTFLDNLGNALATDPVYRAPAIEIMATLDDINGNLDGKVVQADSNNSNLVQVGTARTIRAYLSKTVDSTVLMSWDSPDTTPDVIRQVAGMFIAAQVYFNAMASTSLTIEDINYAQRLYNRAMEMLNGMIAGTIDIGQQAGPVVSVDHLSEGDFFPVDDTDRAFTLGMQL